MSHQEAIKFFRDTFDMQICNFLDGMLSWLTGRPFLDPYKFDKWLHEQHGNYEEAGHSMYSLLAEHYGKEVADKIKLLID